VKREKEARQCRLSIFRFLFFSAFRQLLASSSFPFPRRTRGISSSLPLVLPPAPARAVSEGTRTALATLAGEPRGSGEYSDPRHQFLSSLFLSTHRRLA
jgi:hypothetical protein